MGMFDTPNDKPTISPQGVKSLAIRHWEIIPDQPAVKVVVMVALQNDLTAAGVEVGFFLNHEHIGAAKCDDWGQVVFMAKLPKLSGTAIYQALLSVRVRGSALEQSVTIEYKLPPPPKPQPPKPQPLEIELVQIPAGSFQMGGTGHKNEQPMHGVRIAHPFYLGKYPVTQGQWRAVIGNDPSHFKLGDNHPVEQVSWDDVQQFIARLNQKTGKRYRLPSEAEWEYACRAGTPTEYSWGNTVGQNNANCNGCGSRWDNKSTSPVGSFEPNPWGLYDMHGNVFEWCQDCWHDDYKNAPTDGRAWGEENGGDCGRRVVRGGSWGNDPFFLRSAFRFRYTSVFRYNHIGFRLLLQD